MSSISLRWCVDLWVFDVVLVQFFLDASHLFLLPLFTPSVHFLLDKYRAELCRSEHAIPDPCLFLGLLSEMVVLIEVVVDTHVASEVVGGQIALNC